MTRTKTLFASVIAGATLLMAAGPAAASSLTAKAPDLVVVLANPMNGKIVVRNVGSATSGVADLTVECTAVAKARSCAETRTMAPYENPAYPNKAWVQVPGLKPGKKWVHKLGFWNDLSWPAGTFQFDAEVDAGHAVAETNEGNNTATSTLVVP